MRAQRRGLPEAMRSPLGSPRNRPPRGRRLRAPLRRYPRSYETLVQPVLHLAAGRSGEAAGGDTGEDAAGVVARKCRLFFVSVKRNLVSHARHPCVQCPESVDSPDVAFLTTAYHRGAQSAWYAP